MTDVVVKFKNHVHCKVDTDVGVMQEICDYFTFDQPGARFMPQYRAKLWDGKVRLYSMFTQELYVGLIPYVKAFCEMNGYNFVNQVPDWNTNFDTAEFVHSLNLQGHGKPITIRDYQIAAVDHSIKTGRALLLSPTGSGKSLIIYSLVRYHLQQNRRQLILVPTTSLVEQMFTDFKSYGYDSEEYCHRQYSGKDKSTDKFLTITTWQSIYKNPPEYFEQFDFVLGDEAHQFKAKSLTTIMTGLKNASYRIGCTGTIDGTQTHKLVLEGLFGPLYQSTTTSELIKNKQLADFKIKCLVLKYPDEVCKEMKGKVILNKYNHFDSCIVE